MFLILQLSASDCYKTTTIPLLLDILDDPRPLNSSCANTTGQLFVGILNATFATAIHVNEAAPAVTHLLASFDLYLFPIVDGRISRWISLLVFLGPTVLMLCWLLSVASPKCVTLFLAVIQLPLKTSPSSTLTTSSDYTASPQASFPIGAHSSFPSSGRTY